MDSDSNPIEPASRRLAAALDSLEAAIRRRRDGDRSANALDAEVHSLSQDRSRLAQELDRARARSARLESASEHVSRRIDVAIASINSVLTGERAS